VASASQNSKTTGDRACRVDCRSGCLIEPAPKPASSGHDVATIIDHKDTVKGCER